MTKGHDALEFTLDLTNALERLVDEQAIAPLDLFFFDLKMLEFTAEDIAAAASLPVREVYSSWEKTRRELRESGLMEGYPGFDQE